MPTGIQQQSAKIVQFPTGGRAGLARAFGTREVESFLRVERVVDWRAPYHAEAIVEDETRN